jgi:hypothetical protein
MSAARCAAVVGAAGSLLCGAPGVLAQQLPAEVRAVRAGAPPGGNGRSWATAFGDLHDALAAAGASGGQVTELWLTQGTYQPAGARVCQRFIVSNVSLYGGFAGVETTRAQRGPGPRSKITMLGVSGACSPNGQVGFLSIETKEPVTIDGIEVEQAYPWGNVRISGPATLRNVVIADNGIYAVLRKVGPAPLNMFGCTVTGRTGTGGEPINIVGPGVIANCRIHGGSALGTGPLIRGFQVRHSEVRGGSDNWGLTLNDCTFERCTITGGGEGAGILAGNVQFTDCALDGYASRGGPAMLLSSGRVVRCNVRVWGSSSAYPVALHLNGAEVVDSLLHVDGGRMMSLAGDVSFVNTRIRGGSYYSHGISGGERVTFTNCLLHHSTASGYALLNVGPQWRLTNCIIWRAVNLTEAQVFAAPAGLRGFVNHSCVIGWTGQYGGVGNTGADPRLNADGTLAPASHCIDTADPEAIPTGIERDLRGGCRRVDGDLNGTRLPDIGPYEFTDCPMDCDCGTVGPRMSVNDFMCFLQRYQAGDTWANCDRSFTPPVLNIGDMTCFMQRFAEACR